MLENCNSKEELFQEVEKLISQWLINRQSLIVHFCSFSNIDQNTAPSQENLTDLKEFCQELLDYISTGHFEIFDQLVKESQAFNDDRSSLMQSIYPQITDTTEALLKFDDFIDRGSNLAISSIKTELSTIGETLDRRFLLEDKLIQVLHKSHESETSNLGSVINA